VVHGWAFVEKMPNVTPLWPIGRSIVTLLEHKQHPG